jgi:hypothetical protein
LAAGFGGFGGASVLGASTGGGGGGTAQVDFKTVSCKLPVKNSGFKPEHVIYNSISCMDHYKPFSFEELRCQDYKLGNQNKGAGPSSTSGFSLGNSAGLVAPAGLGSAPAFGSTSGFGTSNATADDATLL